MRVRNERRNESGSYAQTTLQNEESRVGVLASKGCSEQIQETVCRRYHRGLVSKLMMYLPFPRSKTVGGAGGLLEVNKVKFKLSSSFNMTRPEAGLNRSALPAP
jgi:hypothetical protein